MKKFLTNNASETQKIGEEFSKTLKKGDLVLLYGDLGSGKTTFIQGVARGLGIKERILSPTFVLARIHQIPNSKIINLNHIDLYRIGKPTQSDSLGLEEFLNDLDSLTLIEWAQRLKDKPEKFIKVTFKHLENDKREINIENYE